MKILLLSMTFSSVYAIHLRQVLFHGQNSNSSSFLNNIYSRVGLYPKFNGNLTNQRSLADLPSLGGLDLKSLMAAVPGASSLTDTMNNLAAANPLASLGSGSASGLTDTMNNLVAANPLASLGSASGLSDAMNNLAAANPLASLGSGAGSGLTETMNNLVASNPLASLGSASGLSGAMNNLAAANPLASLGSASGLTDTMNNLAAANPLASLGSGAGSGLTDTMNNLAAANPFASLISGDNNAMSGYLDQLAKVQQAAASSLSGLTGGNASSGLSSLIPSMSGLLNPNGGAKTNDSNNMVQQLVSASTGSACPSTCEQWFDGCSLCVCSNSVVGNCATATCSVVTGAYCDKWAAVTL